MEENSAKHQLPLIK